MPEITLDVLGAKLDSLRELTKEKFKQNEKEHATVIEHQKITNGRVNKLEDWKSKATGVFLVVNAILLPILFMLLNKYL